jgi:hypothetical protein
MDLQSVTMEPEAAQQAFREYRAAFMAERNRIDGELMRGYKALAEGKTLVSLTEAIRTGGVDELLRPQLAIARADEREVRMRREADGRVRYEPSSRMARSDDRVLLVPTGALPAIESGSDSWREPWAQPWFARLPFIPPKYRPPHALENYHLLWEAEWHSRSGVAQRRDPVLLRRIGGDLFAVVAAWDLTELEKLVLAR